MFWLRNKKNNFLVRTLVWRPGVHLIKVCLRCVVLAIYDRDRCHSIARYIGKLSPYLKVKIKIYPCFAETRVNHCPVESLFEKLDTDQLASFRSHLIRINTVFHTN